MTWTIISLIIFIGYFALTFSLMYYTNQFTFTLNFYIFQYQLNKNTNKPIIHFLEMALLTLVLIGFITTLISLIQVLIQKRKEHD